MKRRFLLLSALAFTVFLVLDTKQGNSHVVNPDPGNCGDPITNLTCAQSGCHPSPTHPATANDFSLKIGTVTPNTPLNSSFKYAPGTTYNIALLLNGAQADPYYGFQMTALDAANQRAGSFAVISPSTTLITQVGNGTYEYMGHHNANATKNWVFKWTAPAASAGAVTFYLAFNQASVASPPPVNPVGTIYTSTVTIQPNTTGINDLSQSVSDWHVYPNPVQDQLGLSLTMKERATVKAELFDLGGKKVSDLLHQELSAGTTQFSFPTSEWSAGVYVMKISVGDNYVIKKVFHQ